MPTDWLRQTRKRIDQALLCDRLRTPGRMFLSSIGERLDRYHDNIHLSDAQHRKLNELLIIAERNDYKTTNRHHRYPSKRPSVKSIEPQKTVDLGMDRRERQSEPERNQAFLNLSQCIDAAPNDFISSGPLRLK